MALGSIVTLAAALGALIGQLGDGPRCRRTALVMLAGGRRRGAAARFARAVELGYPILGWASVFSLAALACCADRALHKFPANVLNSANQHPDS